MSPKLVVSPSKWGQVGTSGTCPGHVRDIPTKLGRGQVDIQKRIGRKCSVGSTVYKTTNSLDINHLQHASLNWLRGLLKGVLLISKGVTSLRSVFVDPGYLISICITFAVKLMYFVLKALMWFHLGYLVGEVFENEQIQSETYYACGFLGSGSNCSLGNDCVSEFISVLQQLKVYWNRQNVWDVNIQKLSTREGRG